MTTTPTARRRETDYGNDVCARREFGGGCSECASARILGLNEEDMAWVQSQNRFGAAVMKW